MPKNHLEECSDFLLTYCQADLLTPTRIHQLRDFGRVDSQTWVKREDENGFGISGCKKRKYASLLPWLLHQQARPIVLIGGAMSNHLANFSQLLREHRLPFRAYIKENRSPLQHGNALIRALTIMEEEIRWVAAQDWPKVAALAKSENPEALVIPEGGSHPQAMFGAATLALDIARQEEELGQRFQHVFIDSGTGFMAGVLVGMRQWLRPDSITHVVLTAGDEDFFFAQYAQLREWSKELQFSVPFAEARKLVFHPPSTARAFGASNAGIRQYIVASARKHGLLLDPIYTAKLFYTAEEFVKEAPLKGPVLIIHSGGGSGLMGFGKDFFPLS
ncbi:MAG: pyridoxal-phosphate dependent enzyme [Bacteroidota bacterium]